MGNEAKQVTFDSALFQTVLSYRPVIGLTWIFPSLSASVNRFGVFRADNGVLNEADHLVDSRARSGTTGSPTSTLNPLPCGIPMRCLAAVVATATVLLATIRVSSCR